MLRISRLYCVHGCAKGIYWDIWLNFWIEVLDQLLGVCMVIFSLCGTRSEIKHHRAV